MRWPLSRGSDRHEHPDRPAEQQADEPEQSRQSRQSRQPRQTSQPAEGRARPAGPPAARVRPRGPHRDRHGRGLRGPLASPAVPAMVTRSQRFDDVLLQVIERFTPKVGDRLDGVDFAVQIIPDLGGREVAEVPLAETFVDGGRARIVFYRRPIEARARTEAELVDLVTTVVVEQVAALLFLDPHDLDDDYDPGDAG